MRTAFSIAWLVLASVKQLPLAQASCRQQAGGEIEGAREDKLACKVTYDHAPASRVGHPKPQPTNFAVTVKCHKSGNEDEMQLGIELSWKIKGKEVTSVWQREPLTMCVQVTFIYYYNGSNEESGPKIIENGRYMITLESVPILRHRTQRPLKVRTSIMVQNVDTTSILGDSSSISTWTVAAGVFAAIFLLVIAVALAGLVWKRRQADHKELIGSREHRILVLLNVDDKAGVAKQTNWTATALSRIKKMGDVTVKYNRWEMTQISTIGIVRWLDESLSWANKIIISSAPDVLRNEEAASVFDQTFENIMQRYASVEGQAKQVFVIHFQDKDSYQRCRFMNDDTYRKFRLEEDWEALCKCIHGHPGTEQELLYCGKAV